ncbi:GNAT family N-acetyltransferase [Sporofaciens sp. JLR.KK001]|uniref:GNAT family N-acetyltransferase n=1 Tax=Sporofaciens sp. JLR.KK001 TaxID=3112621 RepID=UPI002FEEBC75
MNELVIKTKITSELEEREMNDLITLKQQHWGYSVEEHKNWLADNIYPDDNHMLIYRGGGVLLAYLNAVNVDVSINQSMYRMLGIGNVCVDKDNAHAGVGSILMACINAFIKKADSIGILLCKEPLINFYEHSGWQIIRSQSSFVNGQLFSHTIMNFDPNHKYIKEDASLIEVSRNF